MSSSTKFIVSTVAWGVLCLPVLLLLGIASTYLYQFSDMFSPPYVLRMGEVLLGHLIVFFVPLLITVKYIAHKTELIAFAIVGTLVVGMHFIARSVSVNLSHFMCNDSCGDTVIPLAVDNALTVILITVFSITIVTAVALMNIRLKRR